MVDHVSKPIEPEDLYRVLLKWTVKSASAKATAAESALTSAMPPPPVIMPLTTDISSDVALPTIDGLDMVVGLRRVQNNPHRYIALLRGFADSQSNVVQAIRATTAQGDMEQANRLTHTLKGLAGSIAAPHLIAQCHALELALAPSAPSNALSVAMNAVENALLPLIQSINLALPTQDLAPLHAKFDQAELTRVCERLLSHLALDEIHAQTLLDQHAAMLRAAFATDFDDLVQATRAFDNDRAAGILQRAMHRREVQLRTQPKRPME